MEGVMRHFYQRALIEQRMGPQADWSVVDALMLKTLAAAEKVARYKHAQLSAVRLAGDISGKMDDVSLDELLVTIRQEWAKLAPLIDVEAVQEPQGSRTEGSLTVGSRRIERNQRSFPAFVAPAEAAGSVSARTAYPPRSAIGSGAWTARAGRWAPRETLTSTPATTVRQPGE
jgi:hypothetical protein